RDADGWHERRDGTRREDRVPSGLAPDPPHHRHACPPDRGHGRRCLALRSRDRGVADRPEVPTLSTASPMSRPSLSLAAMLAVWPFTAVAARRSAIPAR